MLLAIVLLVMVISLFDKRKDLVGRGAKAIVLWNIWSFILVEVLSIKHMLDKTGIIIGWGILDVILVLVMIIQYRRNKSCLNIIGFVKRAFEFIIENKLAALTAFIILLLALLTVPYNWDSMTYHLPRITHWTQNQSVAHYATNDVRQVSSPVLAEFINVQVYIIMNNTDYLLNMLQAASYFINAILVYKLAVKIGCQKKFASMSMLLFMTMPIAFAEAINTQIDLFASMWLLIFVYYFLGVYQAEHIRAEKCVIIECLMMAFSLVFGYLSKPSVNIGMAVLLLILFVKRIQKKDSYIELFKIVLIVLPVFALLIPELLRNYQTFAAFSDPLVGERQLVGTLKPNYIFVNMLKNFAQNWPNIYLYDSAEWMAKIVMIVAAIMKVDINDTAISEDGMEYVMTEAPGYNHDSAISPVVIILGFICFIWCICRIKKDRRIGNQYTIGAMLLLSLFCAVVKWQPYVVRYMLAYQVLLCPMIGFQVQEITKKSKVMSIRMAAIPIIYFLCVTELFSLTWFHQERWHEEAGKRPIGYFAKNQAIRPEYDEVFDALSQMHLSKVGINIGYITYEYPIWKMLGNNDVEIRHIGVTNATKIYEDESFVPDCIILSKNQDSSNIINFHGEIYQIDDRLKNNQYLKIYFAEDK